VADDGKRLLRVYLNRVKKFNIVGPIEEALSQES